MISKKSKMYLYIWANESSTTGFAFYQYYTFSVTNNTEEQLDFLLCKTRCKQHFMGIYTCLKIGVAIITEKNHGLKSKVGQDHQTFISVSA